MKRRGWMSMLGILALLLAAAPALPAPGKGVEEVTAAPGSFAWQVEELLRWLVKTRDLVPREKECRGPCFTLESLALTGDVRTGRYAFVLNGAVIADQPVLVPLFGPAQQVVLRNLRLNGQPAVCGFAETGHYYVRTGERRFTVSGELALPGEPSLYIPGPVNLFSAELQNGRVAEGGLIPGLREATLHLERSGGRETGAQTPLFQIARAVRIRKEISFEYRVSLRSGSEIAAVQLPLTAGETVLEVPGIQGWKQEGGELNVPVSGKAPEFTVSGRLSGLEGLALDPRSAYEWWLVESDPEHRTLVETDGRQVDSGESPLERQLPMSKLYLLGRGQRLKLTVRPLVDREALAVIVTRQYRDLVWTRQGDLVIEDTLEYQNNGIDYLPFDCAGKPVFLETDGEARKIMAEKEQRPEEIYIPLQKGTHTARVQSTRSFKPGLLFGRLRVPVARHRLSVSNSILVLGLPGRILPLWFSGGEGVKAALGLFDLFMLALALLPAFLFFRAGLPLWLGWIVLGGLYLALPALFFIFLALLALYALLQLVRRRSRGRLRAWLTALVLVLFLGGGLLLVLERTGSEYGYPAAGVGGISAGSDKFDLAVPGKPQMKRAPTDEEQPREAQVPVQSAMQENLGNTYFAGRNVIEGVVPVPLPMPSWERRVYLHREMVTPDRPLEATLVYATSSVLTLLLLLWLAACAWLAWLRRSRLQLLGRQLLELWRKE